jgi:glycosyltransferase involved in cell wall biosynthesis
MEPSRIKLLKFVTLFDIGGTERHVVNLARRIDPSTFELSVACLRKRGPFLKEIEDLNIPLDEYSISSLRSRRAFREELRCASHIRRSQIQIVHTYGFYPNVFAIPAARLGRASVIVASIRDTGDISTPAQRRVQRFICRLAHCVLVNADAVRKQLIADGYNAEKIEVIKNGLDLSKFSAARGSGKLHREFGFPSEAPLVVVLSRLDRIKGIDYFLEAAAAVAKLFPQARFLIVGNPPPHDESYKGSLVRHAARLGLSQRIIFTGFRLDVPEVLSDTAVSVLPSLSEGLSNTLLESMAAGVPVVATDVGGNPEAVENGVTGLLVPPRDPDALARAVCLLLGNREMAAEMGNAGRERVAKRFSMDQMVRETETLYLKLLNGHGPAYRSQRAKMGVSLA